jgi:hypothetical protein
VLKSLEFAGNKLDALAESKLVALAATLRTRPSALGVSRKVLKVETIVESDENQEGLNVEVPT